MNSSYRCSTQFEPEPCGSSSSPRAYAIRAARSEDLAGLAEILADSFHARAGLMHYLYPLLRLGIYEDLRNRLRSASPHYVCLVAVETAKSASNDLPNSPEKLAGTVEMALRSPPTWEPAPASLLTSDRQQLYISNLAVKARYRRRGVASALLERCEQTALSWGFQDIYLHVLENNHQAQRLYYKSGYQVKQVEFSWSSWLLGQPQRLFLHKAIALKAKTDP